MKKLLLVLSIVSLLYSCQTVESQSISEEQKKDQKFQDLLNKIQETKQQTIISQNKATEKETKIVNNTVDKIVSLKEEVKNLKSELNEKNEKLNGIINDTGSKFKLLPISGN
jgi:glutamine synthetase type III